VELNLTAGVDYYESLIQLGVFESDRAKYVKLITFELYDF